MSSSAHNEARRQLQICNACRYCEGYCAAFHSITQLRTFDDNTITHIANLCHNCRGCFYACQYTDPHEFALNVPRVLSEVRSHTGMEYSWPKSIARLFHRFPKNMAYIMIVSLAAILLIMIGLPPTTGKGFYAIMSHNVMLTIFLPAFLIPLMGFTVGLRRYWRDIGGRSIRISHLSEGLRQAATLENLSGGHGDGCNFERHERFTHQRRYAHHAIACGFLLCLASTLSGTILHYVFNQPAPYPVFSLPKTLGIPGGLLIVIGCLWMHGLKKRAHPELSDSSHAKADDVFLWLLGFVALSGLLLFGLGHTILMPTLLALHLASVLTFFLLIPYSKMTHAFFRLLTLVKHAQGKSILNKN